MNWRDYGLAQIDKELAEVDRILNFQLSWLDRQFWQGKRRELLATKWLVSKFLKSPQPTLPPPKVNQDLPPVNSIIKATIEPLPVSPLDLIFDRVLQSVRHHQKTSDSLLLSLDFLRQDQQQQLFYCIWCEVKQTTLDLERSRLKLDLLIGRIPNLLLIMWQDSIRAFFGRYTTLKRGEEIYDLSELLINNSDIAQKFFLAKIPLMDDLFSYLLLTKPMTIDRHIYKYGDNLANDRASQLLENLIINIAITIAQILINTCPNDEEIKRKYFKPEIFSDREISKLRNQLVWQDRQRQMIQEPIAIFESKHHLFIWDNAEIKNITIYTPRKEELNSLKGIPWLITIILELGDAIAPFLKSSFNFFTKLITYILTEIIGRSLGLIFQGIKENI